MKKKLLAVIFIAVFSLLLSMPSLATRGESINILLGDELAVVSHVQLAYDNRTYAPYDSLFEALGAQAEYDEQDMSVTGILGGTRVTFYLDSSYMSVNGINYYTDATAYLDSESGKIFIPVRYTAQALGYIVGWDSSTMSISMLGVDELIEQSGATYSVIEKYFEYQRELKENPLSFSGEFGLELSFAGMDSDTSYSVSGKMEGLMEKGNLEATVSLSANLAELFGDMPDEQTDALLSLLEETEAQLILNSEQGALYIRSPLLAVLLGRQDLDSWLTLDIDDYYPDLLMGELAVLSAGDLGFKEALSAILKILCVNDTDDVTMTTLLTVNSIISDQAMEAQGDDYYSSFEINEYGTCVSIDISLDFEEGEFRGLELYASMDMDEDGFISLYYISEADGYEGIMLIMEIPYFMDIEAYAQLLFEQTDQTPALEPQEGSIGSLDWLLP